MKKSILVAIMFALIFFWKRSPLFYVVNQKCQLTLSLKAKRKDIYEKQSRRQTQSSLRIGSNV